MSYDLDRLAVREQVIDGWPEATAAAAKLAKDVYAHDMAGQTANGKLLAEWPRYPEADAS